MTIKPVLLVAILGWGLFDVLLGLTCLAAPAMVADTLWPGIGPDGLIMLRRTGVYWLAIGCAQLLAFRRFPDPNLLRAVAMLRVADGLADIAWLASGPAFTPLGFGAIAASPPLSLVFAWLLWREANRGKTERSPGAH